MCGGASAVRIANTGRSIAYIIAIDSRDGIGGGACRSRILDTCVAWARRRKMPARIALYRLALARMTCGVKNIVLVGTVITASTAVGDIRAQNIGLTAVEIVAVAVPIAANTGDSFFCACAGVVRREIVFTAVLGIVIAVGIVRDTGHIDVSILQNRAVI